jgi:hypothetical protein
MAQGSIVVESFARNRETELRVACHPEPRPDLLQKFGWLDFVEEDALKWNASSNVRMKIIG